MQMPSRQEIETMTPMMRQYFDLKSRCPEAILFFRMGDFYEIFGTDAEAVAPILELVLTSRERGDATRIPFCGVPHHSARNYWLRLLKRGYKVAIADQVENPEEAKGLVRREIVRTFTPGCIDDPDGLDRDLPNYVVALHEDPAKHQWCAAVADLSTGELRLGAIDGLAGVRQLLHRFRPREILARRFFHDEIRDHIDACGLDQQVLTEALPEAPLRDKAGQKALFLECFGKSDSAALPCGPVTGGEALVAALLTHFRTLNAGTSQFLTIRPVTEKGTMVLDESAVRDLELLESVRRRQQEGSLFREINHTLTGMGARLLRHILLNPSTDIDVITERQDLIAGLAELGEEGLTSARTVLKSSPDSERILTRIFSGSASPVDVSRVRDSIRAALQIAGLMQNCMPFSGQDKSDTGGAGLGRNVLDGLAASSKTLDLLDKTLLDAPTGLGTGAGVFRSGFDPTLDEINQLASSGTERIEAYQASLREQTSIGSLKIRSHKSFGLMIEVTKANAAKVPADFVRRATMVNCDRFVTEELTELNDALESSTQRAVERELQLFHELLRQLTEARADLRATADALAWADVLISFAWLALRNGYCRPEFIREGQSLEIKAGRHPVVERFIGRHAFVPNDVSFDANRHLLLITGPNMAGKSTVMRQVAVCVIMAQAGCFVPAQSIRLSIFDRVFTRIGASDDLSRGQSTFMVEMSEAASILRHATRRSLVILDEIGRGTSTRDGLAIATAILRDLVARIKAFTLFATHYHELVPEASRYPGLAPMQTEVLERSGKVVFTHRLIGGAADTSYGIEVARLAGLPAHVIADAESALTELVRGTAQSPAPLAQPQTISATESGESRQGGISALGLFDKDAPISDAAERILKKLERINVNRTTPLQAINIINEFKEMLHAGTTRELFPEQTC